MLDSDQFARIGQVLKSNGTDGQVLIGLREIGTEDISGTEPVFIEFDGLPVPFFISDMSIKSGTRFLAHLMDIDSLEDAEELVGKAIYYPADEFETDGLRDFTGWTLYDGGSLIGDVTGIEDIPGNPCLEIKLPSGNTVLVPLHEDLVTNIDEKKKTLSMNLPDGLV